VKTRKEMQEMCEQVIMSGAMKTVICDDTELAHRILRRLKINSRCIESALWCDLAVRALDGILSKMNKSEV